MKQILTFLALMAIAMSALAQRPLATLSHKGELTFFDNNLGLENALKNAANGDTIFLSSGVFVSNSSTVDIKKRVAIIGCGYESKINFNLRVNFTDNSDSYLDIPLFDGVMITQTLSFVSNSNSQKNIYKVVIQNSYINVLENAGYAGEDVLCNNCYINSADFSGANSSNVCVQNSKISKINSSSYNSYINVTNCNIGEAYYLPRTVVSSIIGKGSYGSTGVAFGINGSHYVSNSLLPNGFDSNNSSSVFKESVYQESVNNGFFLDEDLECTLNLEEKGYMGVDGTVIGIHGGYFPFTETPSVPTVDSSNSSVEYDSENNKLNVTITVAPN